MIERRRRHLDLPPGDAVAVFRNHAIQQLELDLAQPQLVVFGELPILGDQGLDARIGGQVDGIEPGQLLPDLQVAQVVDRKPLGHLRAL